MAEETANASLWNFPWNFTVCETFILCGCSWVPTEAASDTKQKKLQEKCDLQGPPLWWDGGGGNLYFHPFLKAV